MLLLKRLIDILLSLVGMLFLIPLVPVVGLLIKMDSRGPIFYPATRVGKGMKLFKMYKFRTMFEIPVKVGQSLSPQYDPRVTSIGRLLRRTKMNEFPQFLNILKGDMTFVGPRPEAPDLAELYPEEARRVFLVKPGLVGPATILGRNEEEVYPSGVDVKQYYIEHILPPKNKVDLEYIDNPSLLKDFAYIFLGLKETLVGALSRRHIRDNRSQIYLLLADTFLMVVSYLFAYAASHWIWDSPIGLWHAVGRLPFLILVRLACNIYFRLYSSLIRYLSYHDIVNVLKGVTFGSFILVLFDFFSTGLIGYFRLILVIDWACLICILSVFRLGLRIYWDRRYRKNGYGDRRRVLIYGVCDEGNATCRALTAENYHPFLVVGFIDDAAANFGKFINGKKVLGGRHQLKDLSKLHRIDEILVADPGIRSDTFQEIKAICIEAGLKVRIANPFEDFSLPSPSIKPAGAAKPLDLLPLREIHADHAKVARALRQQTILVNGPTGALGLELCRKVLQLGCRKLIVIDRYESYLNELMTALWNDFPPDLIVPRIIDAEREDNLEEVFRDCQPGLVIHAGMRKYAPFLGINLGDLGRINYLRTFHLAKAAAKFQSEIFMLISSLWAGNMGHPIPDSLRVAEVSLEHFFGDTSTRFMVARLCDIAENRGGIVSLLDKRIRDREPVILPSAEAQARLLSSASAAEFILKALVEAKEALFAKMIFSCDPGPPIRLTEIVKEIAGFYGLKPDSDFKVDYLDQGAPGWSTSNQKSESQALGLSLQDGIPRPGLAMPPEEVKSLFRDFVLLANRKYASLDWNAKTRELMNAFGPDFFSARP